jgi:YegS/Rv2252/BmrU family lipid kinase
MKHIFILNPVAGRGRASTDILPDVIRAVKAAGVEYEIHRTVNAGDAGRYVKSRCGEYGAEPVRFYAVGGDGTVNEVLNGLCGFEHAELAIVPAGTGNDLVRNFGARADFLDISRQIEGTSAKIDCLRFEKLDEDGRAVESGYALNMLNFGFDAEVVSRTERIKETPFVGGTAAYVGGVLATLAGKRAQPLRVTVDGREVYEGDCLLAGACNGRYSGGGFMGMPEAGLDDGLLDVLLIRDMSRRRFIALVGKYRRGVYQNDPLMQGYYSHYPAREAVFAPAGNMHTAIDGEPQLTGAVRVSIVPGAVSLSLPRGVSHSAGHSGQAAGRAPESIPAE